jgi:hexosaminidase
MKYLILILLFLGSHAVRLCGQTILPTPDYLEKANGQLQLQGKIRMHAQDASASFLHLFYEKLIPKSAVEWCSEKGHSQISWEKDATLPAEGYRILVTPEKMTVRAADNAGFIYAVQSLRQWGTREGDKLIFPCAEITDFPRVKWRSFMLDSGRQYQKVSTIKKYIDMASMLKMNYFHWHLTEGLGWRIEIKRYPLLTRIGAFVGQGPEQQGFYSQEEVKEIVSYAADLGITVVPEIDMPGHMLGALASYPQLGCRGKGYEVWTHWGISKDVLCAGKEETFEFVENVLAEVLDLFPSKFIHVGGDECPKERWKECPACQRRIREEGLANENELQSYFMHRVEKWLHEHGRELIGWDEIMQGGISKSAVIMAWTDQFRGTDAARKGNRVIMTPKWNCYLDYSQTSDPEKYEPIGPTRYLSMRQVYRLDPYDRLKPAEYRNILGIQGNVWTEYIADFGHVQRMTLPRMAAIAEIAWAYDRKDYDDFEKRAKRLLPELYGNAKLKFSEFFFEDIE